MKTSSTLSTPDPTATPELTATSKPLSRSLQAAMLLQKLQGLGPAAYYQLIERFQSPERVIEAATSQLADLLTPAGCTSLRDYQLRRENSSLWLQLEADLHWLGQNRVEVIWVEDDSYPLLLKESTRPPPLLYLKGNKDCLSTPQIAMVGSRNPSSSGREHAHGFAAYLAASGFTITSGLALGIDGAAHQGALDAGGKTIAVLGTGIDSVYPVRHRQLAQRIVDQGGLLVSEFPLRSIAHPSHFPQRNRIISGLSIGVLVVEAALKSGSLITARYALQQNREVFAIPGSIQNPVARGCHSLIREGATLVETAEDMLQELKGLLAFKAEESDGLKNDAPKNESLQRSGYKTNKGRQTRLEFNDVPEAPVDSISTAGAFEHACEPEEKGEAVTPDHHPSLNDQERQVIEKLDFDPVDMDTLLNRVELDVGRLSAVLLGLEVMGIVEQTPHGYQIVVNRQEVK